MNIDELYTAALSLLKTLITTPSLSREEDSTAALIQDFLAQHNIPSQRLLNNVWSVTNSFNPAKPTLFLNSHHDTVKPNPQYTKNPYEPVVEDGKLYGLGSNDAGGCLVSLLAVYVYYYHQPHLTYNLVFVASAEEEISGRNGIEAVLKDAAFLQAVAQIDQPEFKNWCGIVGEPTKMDLAIAEKGLMVLDCVAHGKAGHAAREEGENAIYKALKDINWFSSYSFPKSIEVAGAGKNECYLNSYRKQGAQHGAVDCSFIVDVRVTDDYTMRMF